MAKAKHTHIYKRCILKSIDIYRGNGTILKTGYCEICGKIGEYPGFGGILVMSLDMQAEIEQEILDNSPEVLVVDMKDKNLLDIKYLEVSD